MGRPRKLNRAEVIRIWQEELEADLKPRKSEFARRYKCDRRTIVRILREGVADDILPVAVINPKPFATPTAEPKSKGMIFAWQFCFSLPAYR